MTNDMLTFLVQRRSMHCTIDVILLLVLVMLICIFDNIYSVSLTTFKLETLHPQGGFGYI